jgi:hypothetical protein
VPLSLEDQLNTAISSITSGELDTFSKVLTDPSAVTPEEQRSVAQRLGIKGGLLSAAVNTFADPTLWLAFWMSRRFPSLAWLKGTVPERFIGAANEFTGISQYTRPVETYYRGTPVPRLVALAERRRAEVMRVGERLLGHMDRPGWKDEMPIVSLLLEGQSHPGATPELRRVATAMRLDLEDLWGFLAKTKQIRGGFEGEEITRAVAGDFAPHLAPRHLRDYLPHIPLLGDELVMRVSAREALGKLGSGKVRQLLETVGADPGSVWSIDQTNRLASNWTRYQAFMNQVQGQLWNPHLFHRERTGIPLQSQLGQELFVTDLNVVLQKYVSSVARTYANNAPISNFERALAAVRVKGEDGVERTVLPSNDPIITQVINYGLEAAGGVFTRRQVAGTPHVVDTLDPRSANPLMLTGLRHLVKAVQGRSDEGQIIWGNLFSSVGRHFDQAAGAITNRQRGEVDEAMRTLQRTRSWRGVSNGISSYFYSTTLGMNPWSAIQNLFQPLLTTGPAIGLGPTLSGMRELGRRVPAYASELRRQHALIRSPGAEEMYRAAQPLHRMNEAAQRAFEKVFPDLVQSGIRPDVRAFDIDPAGTVFGGRGKRLFRSYDEYAKFILQPFNHTEMANQVTTFYGARGAIQKAMQAGLYEAPRGVDGKPLAGGLLDEWINFEAGNIVGTTQFRPGPGSKSIWQRSMPSFIQQFSTFPTRSFSFMMESTVRGAMSARELETADALTRVTSLGGRNLGTLARMFMFGRIAVNGLREAAGVDIGNALGITAPFAVAPQGQIIPGFAAPPAAGLVFGLASAAANRDLKEMQPLTLPGYGDIPVPKTLIPGGVGMQRVLRAVHQWRPDAGGFVDDEERLLYRGNTTDLVLSMLGIPIDKQRRVRDQLERVRDVRQKVAGYRREMALARINMDFSREQSLQQEWAETFKGWPPLNVSERDVERYRAAARVPVLQRMMRSMGEAGRVLEREIYEADPELIAPPELPDVDLEAMGAA